MKLDFPAFERHLKNFDFGKLFVEVLGWNHPSSAERAWQASNVPAIDFQYRAVGELGGVMALQVVMGSGVGSVELGQWPDEAMRTKAWKVLSVRHAENILIFTDKTEKASQSQWYWVKRDKHAETGKPKLTPRRHDYFRGQPVDLFASKLQAMVVELSELDSAGRMPVLEAARRIASALDVDKTTKKFFTAYQQQHLELLSHIEGIDDERDKRWYASVLLNRLMFVWFMQKKGFLAVTSAKPFNPDYDYLQTQLKTCQSEDAAKGKNRFFGEFLNALFFEAFAKAETERSPYAARLTGQIPYLNGGLFLHHKLELDAHHVPRVGTTLKVADKAFEGIFNLFASFTWHLDDTPGGNADEINPDVLGYIFEKYINQKAFGAYYTRPEITGYLAERSIHQMILERTHEPAIPELRIKEIKFASVSDLLARMDARTALKLVNEVLPSISILDPAVGSGAFLVAALKTLINVYYAVVGRAELGASSELEQWLRNIKKDHASVGYYIKRRIVTDNLYGVDIMDEAAEIAKLRLFLAMVSSVRRVEDLEPLPNIDFNILAGNSLVGLMRVDEQEFSGKQHGLFAKPFSTLLVEKNRLLSSYRNATEMGLKGEGLMNLREEIDAQILETNETLNDLLVDNFLSLGVKYEQATWDDKKKALGKPVKRVVSRADIAAQTPFHWGYVFDDIIHKRGGFDIILANPPWEVFKPQAKEFFAEYSGVVSKNKMTIKEFEKEQGKLLQNKDVQAAWLEYESRFPHMSSYYRAAPEFKHQSAVVGGKKTGSDLNLYKLFVERCFHLLRHGGQCGIVIPRGIYTDIGATGLRKMLFNQTQLKTLFCFENRKIIFEGVDSRFRFVILTYTKGKETKEFPAAFARHDVEELDYFPQENSLLIKLDLIKKLSPDYLIINEFKSEKDIAIVDKLFLYPKLSECEKTNINFKLSNEFHMTNDSRLYSTEQKDGFLPLFEGSSFWQFNSQYAKPRYFLSLQDVENNLPFKFDGDKWQSHIDSKIAIRLIAQSTDERTLISSILPKNVVSNHNVAIVISKNINENSVLAKLYLVAVLNSFILNWLIRIEGATYIKFSSIYSLPLPKLDAETFYIKVITQHAAKLVCTSPEFDDLAKAVGLSPSTSSGRTEYGATDPAERARLRAELDGLVAHLYGLTESEFVHILATFPLVADPVRVAAHNAYRDVERGLIQ